MSRENNEEESNVNRRNYLKGLAVAGIGAGGLSAASFGTQAQQQVTAEFCGEAQGGAQEDQCINCLPCDDPEVLGTPTGLSGDCYTPPDGIPEGTTHVTLKAGQGCYVASVSADTETICLPDENPTEDPNLYGEISNATFYRCPPNGGEPAVDQVTVTCDSVTIATSNIPEGATLNVTVAFEEGDPLETTADVDENGVATVPLPGDRDPTRVTITYQGETLFDEEVTAEDAPCKIPECPPGLDVKYKFKDCKWVPVSGDPNGLEVEGDRHEATICAAFPFEVEYATRKKGHSKHGGKHHHHHDKKKDHHDGKKKGKHHHDEKKHKHHHGKKCGCKCEVQDPVSAEYDEESGKYCVTIPTDGDSCKKKKEKLCWFRVYCPDDSDDC
ncbi:hypothetical protein [Halomicrococcus sp. NG-SE-24]|uniref:hypothetical protein n=1 Tax=Halomicrococcus sp. NG-SE-24 TaxID=3436928 RepID=UPI003D98CB38